MSSILRALKKLEKDDAPSMPVPMGPGMSGSGQRHKGRTMAKGMIIFAIFILTASGAGFLLRKSGRTLLTRQLAKLRAGISVKKINLEAAPRKPERLSAPPAQNELLKAGAGPEDTTIPPNVSVNQFNAPDQHHAADMETGAVRVGESMPENERTTVSAKPSYPEKSPVNPSSAETENPEQPEGERMISPSPQAPSTENRALAGAGVAEVNENEGLELQAISWAPDPAKSMAVINNRICREKETINGFTIQHIDVDDVIVSNGAITGKLLLKIR